MNKAALRKLYLKKRKALPQQVYQLKNRELVQQFFGFFSFHPPDIVHCFLSIAKNKEPDTWPIIQKLISEGVTIAISKSDLSENLLSHYIYKPGITLAPNRWGIPEPADEAMHCPVQEITAVLVPLLTFDYQGQRVGYGKGYYDRFLKECQPDAIKIGISLEPPVEKIEDINAFDIPLDYCVTPEQVWTFGSN